MKLFCFLFLLSFNYYMQAQESNTKKCRLTAGYYGETVTHSGLTAGIEHYPVQFDKYQMILAANLGGYIHIRNNTSVFLRGQWGQRVTFNSGIFVDQFLGFGYLHNFVHGGDIYEVLDNGAVVTSPNSGKPMVMPSVAIGTGYDLSKKTASSLIVYVRPELFWKAPFNGYYLTHFALNTGIIFNWGRKDEK